MKRLIALLIIAGLGYFGYIYYQNSQLSSTTSPDSLSQGSLVINQTNGKLSDLANVLGTSIENLYVDGKDLLNEATDGKSDPIINKALENIQNEVKDLPKETVDKVKYEFCKDVVVEYENKSVKKETP
jgi:predicted negative regulator of RcsB-dependent stress response